MIRRRRCSTWRAALWPRNDAAHPENQLPALVEELLWLDVKLVQAGHSQPTTAWLAARYLISAYRAKFGKEKTTDLLDEAHKLAGTPFEARHAKWLSATLGLSV
jgi:hypothetical protein